MLAKKTKRILASLLTAAMVVGLLPMSVLAAGGELLSPESKYYATDGTPTSQSNAKVVLSKNAERTAADEWQVTLSAKVNDIQIEQQPLEVTFVLDVSGSMAWCAEEHTHDSSCIGCGLEEHRHGRDCYNWRGQLICNKEEHTHNSSCYTCGKEEHVHISTGWNANVSGGEPCSLVKSGKAQSRLEIAVSAIKNMVATLREQLGNKLNAKIVIFSSKAEHIFDSGYANGVGKGRWDSAKVITESQLDQLVAEGGTNLSDGVALGVDQFKSSSARQVLVVVADGDSDDGYPNRTATNFKNDGGIIYTVGFTFSSSNFNNLATDSDHALLANSDTELGEAMEDISTDITAMIWDPMGDNFSVVKGSAQASGITDGVLNEYSDLITWYPGETQLDRNNDIVTLTYTVKLKDSAKTAGVHTGVPLNGDAELQYKVSNSENGPINADFPLPKASYEVGTMTVEYRDVETVAPISVLPADRTITTITDYGEPVFDVNLPAESVPQGTNQTWFYVSSALDGDREYSDTEANIAATTGEHTLVRYYKLQNSYTVTYQYTGDVPQGAPTAPDSRTYPEGTVLAVEAAPVLPGYEFSGWTTDDAAVSDGKFTVNSDVTFTGSWKALPYYTVVANFYTNTDNEGYNQDNTESVTLKSLTYGDYQDYVASEKQTWEGNGQTYTLNAEATDTQTDGLSTVITLRYERSVTSSAEYEVVHEYYVRTDGVIADTPEDTLTDGPIAGKHDQVIDADTITAKPVNGVYTYTETSRSGDITLDKNSKQTITITYVRDRYTVTTWIDENGTITPDTAVHDAGEDVKVDWKANLGYEVASIKVDGESSSADGTISFNGLDAAHSVEVTTSPIDYQLHVKYVFTDDSTHEDEGFVDYTEEHIYHIGDSYEVTAPAGPAGYTYSPELSAYTSGTFGARDVTVYLTYTPNDKSTAIVLFQDRNGNDLQTAISDSGLVGQSYDVSAAEDYTEITTYGGVRYTFVGDDIATTGAAYSGTLPEGGVTIIRTYEPLPTYTVTYDPGKCGTFKHQITSGLYAGDPTPAFNGTPTGADNWVFDGWSPEVTATVTGDVTYVAQWKEMPKLTVVYELYTSHNGGAYELTDTVTIKDAEYVALGVQSHTAPAAYGDGYALVGEATQSTAALSYNESATLTFRYERQTYGSVDYTVRYVYRTLTGDAENVTVDGYLDVPAAGTHSSVVYAADVEAKPNYNGKLYVFNAAASDKSITLDGSVGQTITLYYDRYEYVVTVNGDEGVASTTGQGTYEKGSDVTVSWTLNPGYELVSVTVNSVDHALSQVELTNLSADATVSLTTKKVLYNVTYYVDGTQYGEVENYYYGDAVTMRPAPSAPSGMTFSGWDKTLTTMPAENVDIHGTFSYIDYTVVYKPGDHGTFDEQSYSGLHYGDDTPAFQGETTGEDTWEFAGWQPEVAETVTGGATYTAQWERSDYTVVVNHVSQATGETMETSTNQYDVDAESAAAPLSADKIPQDFKLVGWTVNAEAADSVTFDQAGNAAINSDRVQTITITYTYGPKAAAYVNINYLLTDGTKDESGAYNVIAPLDMEIKAYKENDAYDVTADVAAFDDAHQMYTRIDADSLTGTISGTQTVIINVYYTADEYEFTVKYFNDYTNQEIEPAEGLTVTGKAPYGTTLTQELVSQYLGYTEGEDWVNAMRPADYEDGVVTYITISDDTAKNVVEVHYDYEVPYNPGYMYYHVTVNYLDRADGSKIAQSYTSPSHIEGSAYDVSEQNAIAIDGYTYDGTEGDSLTGVLNSNKTVNVYYVADSTDIPDDDTPTGDLPDVPGGDDGGQTDIPDDDTPTGDLPDVPGGDGGSGETNIPDGETPTGNLPQTGSVAGQVENRWTLGVLALMASMAAAGLSIAISRKKEEEK
ncbi:vWA domain-containing protein [uncultured Pseudoflavonifractor sp.]|uniref:vWA domain-containing protein n=1 Tax=uncultured Pseudoflavonifractor sp. TaxID=1221379 RepID=UPI0025E54677|nr:vWA domain-containing protein [uncultured Pseudoflavonifractor sp.]